MKRNDQNIKDKKSEGRDENEECKEKKKLIDKSK